MSDPVIPIWLNSYLTDAFNISICTALFMVAYLCFDWGRRRWRGHPELSVVMYSLSAMLLFVALRIGQWPLGSIPAPPGKHWHPLLLEWKWLTTGVFATGVVLSMVYLFDKIKHRSLPERILLGAGVFGFGFIGAIFTLHQ